MCYTSLIVTEKQERFEMIIKLTGLEGKIQFKDDADKQTFIDILVENGIIQKDSKEGSE